jgi:hypothetical protein
MVLYVYMYDRVLCGLNGLQYYLLRFEADGTSPEYNVYFDSKKAHNNVIIYFMARLAEVAVSFFLVLCCSIAHKGWLWSGILSL